MKHELESLNQYRDSIYFNVLFENETDDNKLENQNSQNKSKTRKEGMAVIRKVSQNFKLFKNNASNNIKAYKEFWEKQQKAQTLIKQKGIFYNLYDSKYVVGVVKNAKGQAELKLYDTNYSYDDKENFELFVSKDKLVITEFMKVQKELKSIMKDAISEYKKRIISKKEELKNKNIESQRNAKKDKLDKFINQS